MLRTKIKSNDHPDKDLKAMTNEKDVVVQIMDVYGDCLSDNSGIKLSSRESERPQGFVEIFEVDENNKKALLGKHNLVLYQGREWLLCKAFNTDNINITAAKEESIYWFGVGDGGCPIGDPLNPTSPTNLDTDLDNSIMINATDITYADYRVSPDAGYYKHPFDSLTFEQDADNYNYWLIIRVATTLGTDDGNGFNINEAGLFTATSSAGGHAGNFNLYARVTFPTIVKTSARQLLFVWYVYF